MEPLAQQIGYSFKDAKLLTLALTHPSLSGTHNNQRLEFLGDAILGAVIAHLLYEHYPEEKEGELARRHAALVCSETLAQVAQQIGLGEALHMASGEVAAGGKENQSNLEDAMEALLGAIYLDGGYEAAQNFIHAHWHTLAKEITTPPKDAKTTLQEWVQAKGLPLPNYELVASEGAAHDPLFTVEVSIEGHAPVQAQAKSKRAAEQQAAGQLLQSLSA